MRSLVAIALAVAGHVLVVWIFWRAPSHAASSEWQTEIVAAPPAPHTRRAAPKKGKRGSIAALSARDLAISPSSGPTIGFFRTPDLGDGKGGLGEGFSDGGTAETALQQTGIYGQLYELIDAALEYPADLVEAKIEGFVKVDLVFSEDGFYLPRATEVKCSSLFLKVVVRRAFRRAFGDRRVAFLARLKKRFRVGATFEFGHTYRPDITVVQMHGSPTANVQDENVDRTESQVVQMHRRRAFGNRLEFTRIVNRIPTAKVMELIDSDGHRSYGPGFDILPWITRAADSIDDWAHSRAKIDPLDKYRNDPEW